LSGPFLQHSRLSASVFVMPTARAGPEGGAGRAAAPGPQNLGAPIQTCRCTARLCCSHGRLDKGRTVRGRRKDGTINVNGWPYEKFKAHPSRVYAMTRLWIYKAQMCWQTVAETI
jgi:hypothetical protein